VGEVIVSGILVERFERVAVQRIEVYCGDVYQGYFVGFGVVGVVDAYFWWFGSGVDWCG